jgi:hypothetical protein
MTGTLFELQRAKGTELDLGYIELLSHNNINDKSNPCPCAPFVEMFFLRK